MQRRHVYPERRNQWPTYWLARAGATVDDPPLPAQTAGRTIAIRGVFLRDFGGRATIADVVDACDHKGLLHALSTYRSAYETVMVALRPVSTSNVWDSIHRPAYAPLSPPG